MKNLTYQCKNLQLREKCYDISSFRDFNDEKNRAERKMFCQALSYELEMLKVPKRNVRDITLSLFAFISKGIIIPNMVECGNNTLFAFFKDTPYNNTTGIKMSIKIEVKTQRIIVFLERSDEDSDENNARIMIS